MKRFISLLLCLVLMVGCLSMTASAASAKYKTTKDFLKMMDEADIIYTFYGKDDDNDEVVRLKVEGDETDYTINLYFNEDEDLCSVRVWNIIEYAEEDFVEVLKACNELNRGFRYCKVVADYEDNTVTVEMDIILIGEFPGATVMEGVYYIVQMVDYVYAAVEEYNIA